MINLNDVLYNEGTTDITLMSDPAGDLVLKLSGEIAQLNPGEFLDAALRRVHETALEQKVQQVSVDFTALDFLNSSGIKAFGGWVMAYMKVDASERYRLEFVYSRAITWQAASLKALSALSRGAVSLSAV